MQVGVGIGQVRPDFDRSEPGLQNFLQAWPMAFHRPYLAWPGLTYLKVWPDLEAYFQAYFILKSLNIQLCLLLNRPPYSLFHRKSCLLL
jgi:hypothetical protein